MKTWTQPELIQLDVKMTEYAPNVENLTSGSKGEEDLWTCHGQYWAGNGLTVEESREQNGWDAGGGWGSDGGWGAGGGWGSN